jgi:hypothetical protein
MMPDESYASDEANGKFYFEGGKAFAGVSVFGCVPQFALRSIYQGYRED